MAAPDSRAVVLEYLALLERHDLDGLDAVVAEDLVVIAPDGRIAFSDRSAWKRALADDPFSGEQIEVEDIVVEGGTVALRFRLTAVHSGTAFGVAATARRITTSGTKVYTLRDGRIVQIAGHDDVLGLLRQLGVRELPAER